MTLVESPAVIGGAGALGALRDQMRDAVAEAIGCTTYDCTRVWSAWSYGTMSQDDFELTADNEDRLYEIVDAALAVVSTRLAAAEAEVLTLRTMQVARKAWTADVDRDYKSDHGEYFHATCGLCGSPFYGGKGRVVCAVCKPTGELLAQTRERLAAAERDAKEARHIVDLLRSLDDADSRTQLRTGASIFVKARISQILDAARATGGRDA